MLRFPSQKAIWNIDIVRIQLEHSWSECRIEPYTISLSQDQLQFESSRYDYWIIHGNDKGWPPLFFRPASKRYLNLNRSFKFYQVGAVQTWRRIQMMTFSPKLHNKFKEKLEFHLRISETWYGFEGIFFHSLKFGYENQLLSWYHQPAMTTCQGNGINVSSSRTISLTFFIRNDWKYNFLSRNIL